jgi:hypothetical protein
MSQFIKITIVKESEEGLEHDMSVILNTHYILKISDPTEDEYGKAVIAMATGEFLYVQETKEELKGMIG